MLAGSDLSCASEDLSEKEAARKSQQAAIFEQMEQSMTSKSPENRVLSSISIGNPKLRQWDKDGKTQISDFLQKMERPPNVVLDPTTGTFVLGNTIRPNLADEIREATSGVRPASKPSGDQQVRPSFYSNPPVLGGIPYRTNNHNFDKPPSFSSGIAEEHIKRPMNAFMLWSVDERQRLRQGPMSKCHNTVISQELGRLWKQMSREEKRPFFDRAAEIKALHLLTYPNYKLRLNRNKKRGKEERKGLKRARSPSNDQQFAPAPPFYPPYQFDPQQQQFMEQFPHSEYGQMDNSLPELSRFLASRPSADQSAWNTDPQQAAFNQEMLFNQGLLQHADQYASQLPMHFYHPQQMFPQQMFDQQQQQYFQPPLMHDGFGYVLGGPEFQPPQYMDQFGNLLDEDLNAVPQQQHYDDNLSPSPSAAQAAKESPDSGVGGSPRTHTPTDKSTDADQLHAFHNFP